MPVARSSFINSLRMRARGPSWGRAEYHPAASRPAARLPEEIPERPDRRAIFVQDVLARPDRRDASRMELAIAHQAHDDGHVVVQVARRELAVEAEQAQHAVGV